MKKNYLIGRFILPAVLVLLHAAVPSHAGNFGFGAHTGYGVIKYEERVSKETSEVDEAKSTLNTVLFGVSGEYTFPKASNFFVGITTDWVFGLEDDETFSKNGEKVQTNDISLFGQFYDGRIGYKDNISSLSYRVYASGGWDGIHFRRKNFVKNGIPLDVDVITEDFSLWRIGGGLGLGYSLGNKWTLDGRAAYSYYFDGEVRNSNQGGLVFDTNGTCFDAGIGIMREINKNTGVYVGGSYTLIDLDESEVIDDFIFPESRTRMMVGVINLTYAF